MIVLTSFYTGIIGLFYFALSINVIRNRFRFKQSLGAGNETKMEKAVRVHGNFSEYAPLVLLMMGFLELGKESSTTLHIIGGCLLAGRILHAIGLGFIEGTSPFRSIGMVLTFTAMVGGSIRLIVMALNMGF